MIPEKAIIKNKRGVIVKVNNGNMTINQIDIKKLEQLVKRLERAALVISAASSVG